VNTEKVEQLIRENRRIKQSEIAEALHISQNRVSVIVKNLGFKKVCARWVPRMLTDDLKKRRVDASKELLARYRSQGRASFLSIVMGDETWVHHYDPETKRQSMEYRHPNSPRVRKFKTQKSANKIMMTVFWDS